MVRAKYLRIGLFRYQSTVNEAEQTENNILILFLQNIHVEYYQHFNKVKNIYTGKI